MSTLNASISDAISWDLWNVTCRQLTMYMWSIIWTACELLLMGLTGQMVSTPLLWSYSDDCRRSPIACLHKKRDCINFFNPVVTMALDVAQGLEYLHSWGVVHRDLKSENLVLTSDLHVKLTEFGVGCLETECDFQIHDTGTYGWMAPEMINHKHYSKKVDVYSFGVVLWELVTGSCHLKK